MSEIIGLNPLNAWNFSAEQKRNFVFQNTIPAKEAQIQPFPDDLHPALIDTLSHLGITGLYTHQNAAWQNTRAQHHQVIVTGTASGKSLCYQLPILESSIQNPDARSLCVFPTKALAQDQLNSLKVMQNELKSKIPPSVFLSAGIYDGDTPSQNRKNIRETARVILTNPDMLHTAILPRHPSWGYFFANLEYIVLDEIHYYRGVFGSHVANVVRRLERICEYYGSSPKFILTSATIRNPAEHAQALIGQQVELVDQDGSGRGSRVFGLYNPPISDPELGIRKSALFETIHLLTPLLKQNTQTIVFGRARKTIELVRNYLSQLHPEFNGQVASYRSGYLPEVRRKIEQGLREQTTKAVITTNALELGIDIGSMDASLLIGYPGSIASTLQQIGRAGRQTREALSILVATSDPLDQYLAHHPDYFLGLSPEQALIDPDHLMILLDHLRCAAYELPFSSQPKFGTVSSDVLQQFLDILLSMELLSIEGGNYFWVSTEYPASSFSLRTVSNEPIRLRARTGDFLTTIGTVDKLSAYWMVHPDAIYLQDGKSYIVRSLDLENASAELEEVEEDYFTEPQKHIEIHVLKSLAAGERPAYSTGFGEVQVSTQVKGFKKIKYFTHLELDRKELDMPVVEFPTIGCWVVLKESAVEKLRSHGVWLNDANDYGPGWADTRLAVRSRDEFRCRVCGIRESRTSHHVHHVVPFRSFTSIQKANDPENLVTLCPTCHKIAETNLHMQSGLAGAAYAFLHLAPLFLMCDQNDIEVVPEPQASAHTGLPTITVYDNVPGGIGLSRAVYDRLNEILTAIQQLITSCGCQSGCPSCIGPAGENGYGGKNEALAIIEMMLEDAHG